MTAPRPARASLLHEERGAVFLELLIVFIPIWTLAVCTFQLALIAQASLVVKHAADSAARSASVTLPDDPSEYGGEAEMSVARNRVTGWDLDGVLGRAASILESPTVDAIASAFSNQVIGNLGRSRLNTIRVAAHIPLMPLAPSNVGRDPHPSLRKSLSGKRSLASALFYQPFAVAVTFPGVIEDRVSGPEVTVRVTYAFQCTVPLARRILCDGFRSLEGDEWDDAFLPFAQSFVGGRFRRIARETTVLVQDAPYAYRPRGT